jgi:hypothetical protein
MSFKIFFVLLNLWGAFVFAQVPPGYGALMGALADARSPNVSQGERNQVLGIAIKEYRKLLCEYHHLTEDQLLKKI